MRTARGSRRGTIPKAGKTCRKDVCRRESRRSPGALAARRQHCGGFGDVACGRIACEFDVDVLEASEKNISPLTSYSYQSMGICPSSNLVETLSEKCRNVN